MASPLSSAHAVTRLPARDLERGRGLELEHVESELPSVEHGDVIAAPDDYPSKGSGERGAFFVDCEGNLVGVGQATP